MKNKDTLKLAFEEAAEKELNSLPKEGDIVRPYSKNFTKKMDKLFDEVGGEKTAPLRRKKIRWAALIAAVLMSLVLTVTVSASDLTPKDMLMLMGLWSEPDPENYVSVDWEIKGAYAAGRADNAHKEVIYDGDEIIIKYVIDEGAHSVQQEKGLILFLDGVRQKFTVKSGDEITKDTDMYIIGGKPGTVEAIEISFLPNIGKKGETLALSLCSVTDPDDSEGICVTGEFRRDWHMDEDSDSICDDCLVDVTVPRSLRAFILSNDVFAHLIMEEDASEQKAVSTGVTGMKEAPVHEKIRAMYNYEEPAGDGSEYYNTYDKLESINAVLYKDIDETVIYENDHPFLKDTFTLHKTNFTTEGEESEEFTLNLHGKPGEYRVAFYIGTEPQPVFDGAENIDVTIHEGNQIELPIELDTAKLPKGDNRYYVVYKKMGKDHFEHGWWWEYQICEGIITVE
ncbi:MAG: hypothetical protein E7543_02675 [Ruminococcaceae bacterium]|nr:hypothetical protein [Oscillospiraceae bacterium]